MTAPPNHALHRSLEGAGECSAGAQKYSAPASPVEVRASAGERERQAS